MLFSSTLFVFAYLPVVLLGYFLAPKPLKNYFLLLCSLVFYAWGEPVFVIAMIGSIIGNYVFALLIDRFRGRRKLAIAFLVSTLVFNLGLLFAFKYLDFLIVNINHIFGNVLGKTSIVLPIGISFFTFQALSYVIDVYRNDVPVQKNPFYVGLYISFFPQLIAGPIVRYTTIAEQIKERTITFDGFSAGVKRFVIGLGKKVLLANTLAVVADKAFAVSHPDALSVSFAWLGAIAYAFQIFFDFSGYSDMAIGLGAMFGFRFLENFNYPYISQSISEFWRRWHISLSTWFRDYVYFPLGGSRVEKKSRLVFNLFVVWLLTGAWHGASWNFVIWGLFYFALIAFEKLSGYPGKFRTKTARILYRAFTLLCVLGGWVLFRSVGMHQALGYGLSMFGLAGNAVFDGNAAFYFSEFWAFFLAAIIISTPVSKTIQRRLGGHPALSKTFDMTSAAACLVLFLVSISYLVLDTYNPFIYFNF